MRARQRRLIVAFYTTHDAMAFEDFCAARGVPGRLIPLPREISAGCGLAWSAPPGNAPEIQALLREAGIAAQHLKELDI